MLTLGLRLLLRVPPPTMLGAAPGPRACLSALLTLGLVGGRQGLLEPRVATPRAVLAAWGPGFPCLLGLLTVLLPFETFYKVTRSMSPWWKSGGHSVGHDGAAGVESGNQGEIDGVPTPRPWAGLCTETTPRGQFGPLEC